MFKRRRTNPLQPQSVNPRQGAVSARVPTYNQPSSSWAARHKLVLILISSLIGIGILVAIWQLVNTSWLVVRHIQATQLVMVDPEVVTESQVSQTLQAYQGQSLVLLNESKLNQDLTQKLAGIAAVYVVKEYPSTLKVQFQPHIALAQIVAPQGRFLVNQKGLIFSDKPSHNLPQIVTQNANLKVGDTIPAQGVDVALHLITGLRQIEPGLASITLNNQQLDVLLDKDPKILVGLQLPADQVVLTIIDLLQTFKEQQKTPKVVDLRFDRPVLQY